MGQHVGTINCAYHFCGGRVVFALLLALLLPLVPGLRRDPGSANPPQDCEGQEEKKKKEDEEKKKDKPKPKPDFEKLKLTALPHDGQDLTQRVKPGHWVSATLGGQGQQLRLRRRTWKRAFSRAWAKPIDLEHTSYRLLTSRPAVLPKGQAQAIGIVVLRAAKHRHHGVDHALVRSRRWGRGLARPSTGNALARVSVLHVRAVEPARSLSLPEGHQFDQASARRSGERQGPRSLLSRAVATRRTNGRPSLAPACLDEHCRAGLGRHPSQGAPQRSTTSDARLVALGRTDS